MLICSITHPSPELKMTSNRSRHVKPLQVKYWSQRNHLKLLTENSMTRQGHDLFGQFPNPHCSCMWYVSVSCSISHSCFTWKCHHSSAFARTTDRVILMWFLPPWPFLLLLYSRLPHYPLPWSPSRGEGSTFERHWHFIKHYASPSRHSQLSCRWPIYSLYCSSPSKFTLCPLLNSWSTNIQDKAQSFKPNTFKQWFLIWPFSSIWHWKITLNHSTFHAKHNPFTQVIILNLI